MSKIIVLWRSFINNIIRIFGLAQALQCSGLNSTYLKSIDLPIMNPQLVEIVLYVDTLLLLIMWSIILGNLLFRIVTLTYGDLSGPTKCKEVDGWLELVFFKHYEKMKLLLFLCSFQILAGESLLYIVFGMLLVSWLIFNIWIEAYLLFSTEKHC
jgi:hypothetical protein